MALFEFFIPGGSFSIDIVPDPDVYASGFDAMAAAIDNMYPPLKGSQDVFIAGVHRHFDSAGPGWAPPKRDYGHALLQDTGETRAGATSEGSYAITGRQVAFHGGAMPQRGWWHQFGATRSTRFGAETRKWAEEAGLEVVEGAGFNVLPARPFIYTDAETEAAIYAIWEAWFDSVIGGFGAGVGGSYKVSKFGRVQAIMPGGQFGPGVH